MPLNIPQGSTAIVLLDLWSALVSLLMRILLLTGKLWTLWVLQVKLRLQEPSHDCLRAPAQSFVMIICDFYTMASFPCVCTFSAAFHLMALEEVVILHIQCAKSPNHVLRCLVMANCLGSENTGDARQENKHPTEKKHVSWRSRYETPLNCLQPFDWTTCQKWLGKISLSTNKRGEIFLTQGE